MDDETKGAEMSVKRKKQLMTSLDEIFIKIGMLQLYILAAPLLQQPHKMLSWSARQLTLFLMGYFTCIIGGDNNTFLSDGKNIFLLFWIGFGWWLDVYNLYTYAEKKIFLTKKYV